MPRAAPVTTATLHVSGAASGTHCTRTFVQIRLRRRLAAKHARLDVRPHLSRCLTRGGDPSGGGSDHQIASNRIGLVHRALDLAEALKHRKRRLVPLLETGYDPALRELF